jgi:hypothetical protein
MLYALSACAAAGQVIEFESGGLKYQTLTKGGVTIMFANLPSQVREYSIMQVAISNGSPIAWTFRPEDFYFRRTDGTTIQAVSAHTVIDELIRRANRNDVIKLVSTYEMGLYGLRRIRSTSGYEQRRQAALAEVSSTKLKAAAAASAIALVKTQLKPGESTDGAVFYPTLGKPLGGGHLTVNAAGDVFEFEVTPAPSVADPRP